MSRYLALVRRGQFDIFQTLREHFREEPDVEVMWDRRIGERRTGRRTGRPDRRRGERRGEPTRSWQLLGLMLIRSETPAG